MKSNDRRGFTLVEVIVALVILTFVGAGISRNLIMTRRMAESNVREISAISAASGYIEQLKSMEYGKILTSVVDPQVSLPTVLSQGEPDPVKIGQWVEKKIVIDENPETNEQQTMPFYIFIDIDDLNSSGNGAILGISVFFAWDNADSSARIERSLRTMRSRVLTP